MRKALASLLLSFVAASAHAGSFGGPPPFSDGSPLITGIDGSYQASARGQNLSGVFRFSYSGGMQTSAPTSTNGLFSDPYNDYVFFVNGLVYRGPVQANINGSSVTGVLDNGGAFIANFQGSTAGPFIESGMSGYFRGKVASRNAPNYNFSGSGTVAIINMTSGSTTTTVSGNPPVTTTITTPATASQGPIVGYRFSGVKTAFAGQ
jgi:hypothetical protein